MIRERRFFKEAPVFNCCVVTQYKYPSVDDFTYTFATASRSDVVDRFKFMPYGNRIKYRKRITDSYYHFTYCINDTTYIKYGFIIQKMYQYRIRFPYNSLYNLSTPFFFILGYTRFRVLLSLFLHRSKVNTTCMILVRSKNAFSPLSSPGKENSLPYVVCREPWLNSP